MLVIKYQGFILKVPFMIYPGVLQSQANIFCFPHLLFYNDIGVPDDDPVRAADILKRLRSVKFYILL